MNSPLFFVLIMIVIIIIVYLFIVSNQNQESFGALQSLYSNDGIQDTHLTINQHTPKLVSTTGQFDDHDKWQDFPWHTQTRNLYRISVNPSHYEYYPDRYSKFSPYW
jgi:hypothetical protein